MKKRRIKWLFVIPAALALGIISFLISAILDDPTKHPEIPASSTADILTLTSNGCCFWVEDVKVWLEDESGNRIDLSTDEQVHEYDIINHRLPDYQGSGPLELNVEFRCFYGDECDFSLPVLEFSSFDELRETGVLLFFQEHDDVYFNVIAGSRRVSYKMGGSDSRWNLSASPDL